MPSETPFAVVKRMLESAGYRLARVRGSHQIFIRAVGPRIVVPVHRAKVKDCYVRQIKKIVAGD